MAGFSPMSQFIPETLPAMPDLFGIELHLDVWGNTTVFYPLAIGALNRDARNLNPFAPIGQYV